MSTGAAGVLFSGGKDSALAALLLEGFYDVTLVTCHAGVTDAADHAAAAAAAIGFPHERLAMADSVAVEAVDRMHEDGFPRHGIQRVHEHALELVAGADFDAVADGTRRDDRVPTVSRAAAQSLEDRHGVDYCQPLAGFGRRAVDRLVASVLRVETGPSETLVQGDYEAELRALLTDRHGDSAVDAVFPDHAQTRVVGRR